MTRTPNNTMTCDAPWEAAMNYKLLIKLAMILWAVFIYNFSKP